MSRKAEAYRDTLRELRDWEPFLRAESGLPGPRGNLELAAAVADEGDETRFRRLLRWDPTIAPTNTPEEFLAFCGVVGLGKLLAGGETRVLRELRRWASDPRWRLREAVAIALQRWGRVEMPGLLREMGAWSRGTRFEQRAAVAALCEPDLLHRPARVRRVLAILDRITASLASAGDRKSAEFLTLRKALGYGWSVAVAAFPAQGKPKVERWISNPDPDIRWVMRENLRKARLVRIDAGWVKRNLKELGK